MIRFPFVLLLWVGGYGLLADEAGVPEPLGLEQALGRAEQHPRSLLDTETLRRYPRHQPLYLDCHALAYSSTAGMDDRRNRIGDGLLAPVVAQRLEIMQRFFDVLLADLRYARDNEAMAVAFVQFDRAGARRDLGQYSELRVLELEAAYEDIRRRRAASIAAQRLTRALLAQAIDRPTDLPRDLAPLRAPIPAGESPDLDEVVATAMTDNRWLAELKANKDGPERRLLDLALRQQVLELLLRLEGLAAARRYALTESARRDLLLDESRTLYEQEVKSDLGFSMSQQTLARLREQRVAYCEVLARAELNALQGRPVWPLTGVPGGP